MAVGIDDTREIDITSSFVTVHDNQKSFLRKSKRTMLIFRKISDKKAKCTLELRHQRTCDVVFDWQMLDKTKNYRGPINSDGIERSDHFKPHNYIYKMIETMLPKAMVNPENKHLRLLEL